MTGRSLQQIQADTTRMIRMDGTQMGSIPEIGRFKNIRKSSSKSAKSFGFRALGHVLRLGLKALKD
jgi:hypothetical protein